MIQDCDRIIAHPIRAGRPRRTTESAHVVSDYLVVPGQLGYLTVPQATVGRPTVDEQDGRSVARSVPGDCAFAGAGNCQVGHASPPEARHRSDLTRPYAVSQTQFGLCNPARR